MTGTFFSVAPVQNQWQDDETALHDDQVPIQGTSFTGKGMHRGISQHTRPCQEGGIKNEKKSQYNKKITGFERIARALKDQDRVDTRYQQEPGHHRCILYRIPCPISAKG